MKDIDTAQQQPQPQPPTTLHHKLEIPWYSLYQAIIRKQKLLVCMDKPQNSWIWNRKCSYGLQKAKKK